MDLALDANILIADPWLRSQRMRVLLDYLRKTGSTLILLAPVEAEVRAEVKRQFENVVSRLEAAFRSAERSHLIGLPSVDLSDVRLRSVEAWEQHFDRTMSKTANVFRPTLDNSVLPEALNRAIQRIAPCSPNGGEMRDAVIWLSFLKTCEFRGVPEVAFISGNTNDFANPDKSLRSELRAELVNAPFEVHYYDSLESFLQEHAERFAHITVDWVRARVDATSLEQLIQRYLERGPHHFYRIADQGLVRYYEPWGSVGVTLVRVTIDDVYIWKFDAEHIEIGLSLEVFVEAEVECYRKSIPWEYGEYSDRFEGHMYTSADLIRAEEAFPQYRTLLCSANLWGHVAADLTGNTIVLKHVEEVYA